MSESEKEQLSVFVDGEFDDQQALALFARNERLLKTWARYHLISACMKQQCPARVDKQLATRVSQAVASEPALVSESVPLTPLKRAFPPALKPVAGLALAASVATVAILAVQQQGVDESLDLSGQPPVASNASPLVQQQIRNVSTANNSAQRPGNRLDNRADDRAGNRMNSYLVNYNEYRAHAGMQGMLPYARVVTHRREP